MTYSPGKFYQPVANATLTHRTETSSGVYSSAVEIKYALIPNAAKLTFPVVAVSAGFGNVELDLVFSSAVSLDVFYLAGLSINSGLTISLYKNDSGLVLVSTRVQDSYSATNTTANEIKAFTAATATNWRMVISGVAIVAGNRIQFDINSLFFGVLGFVPTDDNFSWGFKEQDTQEYNLSVSATQAFAHEILTLRHFELSYRGLSDADSRTFARFQKALNAAFCLVDMNPDDPEPESKILGTLVSSSRSADQTDFNSRTLLITEKRK